MFKSPKTYQKIDIDYFEDMFETSEPIQLPFMSQTKATTANNNSSTGGLKDTSPEESIEEFAEVSEPKSTTDKVIQIFRKFATSGQMSKTEYQIVKQYTIENADEVRQFIQKINARKGILGKYDTKLASILNNIVPVPQKQAPEV